MPPQNVTQKVTDCLWCGKPLPQQEGRGRRRVFCKPSCKQRAYESRKNNMPELWKHLRKFDRCYICGETLDWFNPSSIVTDHMVATVHGGVTEPANLRPVHMRCNAVKGTKYLTPEIS